MSWRGSVISGSIGASLVSVKAYHWDITQLEDYKRDSKSNLKIYRPWMSHLEVSKIFRDFGDKYETKNFQLKKETLKNLSEKMDGGGKTLKSIHKNSNGKIGVLTPSNPSFSEQYQQLDYCLNLLKTNNPFFYRRLERIVDEIILQCSTEEKYTLRERGTGLSSFDYRKGVFLSIPTSKYWEADLLINLWHEVGHQSLITHQLDDKIINESHMSMIFSVIRNTERPAILSFHAMIACLFMLEFLTENHKWISKISSRDFVTDYIKFTRVKIKSAVNSLRELDLTDLGSAIINECMAMYIYSERFLAKCEAF